MLEGRQKTGFSIYHFLPPPPPYLTSPSTPRVGTKSTQLQKKCLWIC